MLRHCCGWHMFHVTVSASFLLLSLSGRIVWSQSSPSDHRPMFVLVSLFLVCHPVFLLLLSAEYHNVLMCSSLGGPHPGIGIYVWFLDIRWSNSIKDIQAVYVCWSHKPSDAFTAASPGHSVQDPVSLCPSFPLC